MTKMKSEAVVHVDDTPLPLKLTLGALAEMEEALGADTLAELAVKLANPSAGQLMLILRIMGKAAGEGEATARLDQGSVNLREAIGAVSRLFQDLMAGQAPGKPPLESDAGKGG
ncbi:MAG: GTA-gp10 family protein [Pseudomonadota bacterium]